MSNGAWILVTDACRARIFVDHGIRNDLEEIEGFANPHGREHIRKRVADRAGLKPAGPNGVRSGASQEVDPKEAEALVFARFLADTLKKRHNEKAFKELVIVAPPHVLGNLRSAMDSALSKCVVASFDKDFISLDRHELSKRIHTAVR